MDDVRVLIVSPDPLVRGGLASMLASAEELIMAGQVGLEQLSDADIEVYQPQLLLLDADIDDPDEVRQVFALQRYDLPLVLITSASSERFSQFFRSRSASILTRTASLDQIRTAIQAAAIGLVVVESDTTPPDPIFDNESRYEPLTAREMEILEQIARGSTNKAIAAHLGISENTVKFHVNTILSKLDAQSRTEAVVIASRLGWLHI
jgi:DNA-binding NarL/FixJ family response regulator